MEIRHLVEEDFFEHPLDAPGDVVMEAEELRLRRSGGRSEEIDQAIGVHPVAPQEIEVLEVELILAGLSPRHQLSHLLDIARLAVRSEPPSPCTPRR